jgi:hypothetical protein
MEFCRVEVCKSMIYKLLHAFLRKKKRTRIAADSLGFVCRIGEIAADKYASISVNAHFSFVAWA